MFPLPTLGVAVTCSYVRRSSRPGRCRRSRPRARRRRMPAPGRRPPGSRCSSPRDRSAGRADGRSLDSRFPARPTPSPRRARRPASATARWPPPPAAESGWRRPAGPARIDLHECRRGAVGYPHKPLADCEPAGNRDTRVEKRDHLPRGRVDPRQVTGRREAPERACAEARGNHASGNCLPDRLAAADREQDDRVGLSEDARARALRPAVPTSRPAAAAPAARASAAADRSSLRRRFIAWLPTGVYIERRVLAKNRLLQLLQHRPGSIPSSSTSCFRVSL